MLHRLFNDGDSRPKDSGDCTGYGSARLTILAIGGCALIASSRWALHAWGQSEISSWLLKEDGLIESLGAVCCLAGALLFFVSAWLTVTGPKTSQYWRRRLCMYLAMSGLMGLLWLEEISWGQRLIGGGRLDWFAGKNAIGESNLHNLRIFQPSRQMNLIQIAGYAATVLYLGILPLAAWLSPRWRSCLDQLGVLVPRLSIAAAFWTALATLRAAALFVRDQFPAAANQENPELFEAISEGLMLAVACDALLLGGQIPIVVVAAAGCVVIAFGATQVAPLAGSLSHIRSEGLRAQGDQLLVLDMTDAARERFEQAARLDPANASARLRLGLLLLKQGQAQRGVAHLETAVKHRPDNGDLWIALASARSAIKQHQQAVAAWRRALEIAPDRKDALLGLAKAQAEAGAAGEAVATLEQAVRDDPDFAHGHALLGEILLGMRHYALAARYFEQALQVDPTLDWARARLERARSLGASSNSPTATSH